jgi:uncharacterized membrane protein
VHTHPHGREHRSDPVVVKRLAAAVAPFVVAAMIGLVVLWPSGDGGDLPQGPEPAERYRATVVSVQQDGCEAPPTGGDLRCSMVEVRLDEGPDESGTFSFAATAGANQRGFEPEDRILVTKAPAWQPGPEYFFADYQRDKPLILLVGLFAVVVIALSRWRGITSLIGLAISLLILVRFVIPAILEGSNPVAVAIVGSTAIMLIALYLAHGVNVWTTCAVLGTFASLALTGALAVGFVDLSQFTGFGTEEAAFLQISAGQINLEGLLLGGIIIGTLGVLDDVTVTQASAVWELHLANPGYGVPQLYRSAIRIGRDHIASTVNTLVLAYAGASLPLLILFTLSSQSLTGVLTSEVVAEEIVRTLVGSIGLVASVPITTALAALVVSRHGPAPAPADPDPLVPTRPRSKFEREWFGSEDES